MRAPRIIASAILAMAALACQRGAEATQDASVYVPSTGDGLDAGTDGSSVPGLGQVDRAGRPLVAVLLVPSSLEDEYNAMSTFDAVLPRVLENALTSRLRSLDTIALDEGGSDPVDWDFDGGNHPLLPMLGLDALLVDTARSCMSPDGGFAASYLDIEREIFLFGDAGHTTCGGRTPSDDVVDTTLTLLVTNGRVPVSQGVAGPTTPPMTQFPYLAAPNPN
jgi:hypothetical protein